jgi:hypothetical protein
MEEDGEDENENERTEGVYPRRRMNKLAAF